MSDKESRPIRRRGVAATRDAGWTRLWSSRGFVLMLALVVLFLGISVTKELIRRIEMRAEIASLETDVERLTKRNTEIDDLIALFSTSAQQDKEARVKLGLQSPGETVIVLPHRQTEKEIVLPDSDRIDYIPVHSQKTNPEKWLHFFWDKLDTIYSTET